MMALTLKCWRGSWMGIEKQQSDALRNEKGLRQMNISYQNRFLINCRKRMKDYTRMNSAYVAAFLSQLSQGNGKKRVFEVKRRVLFFSLF
jgi:hypothetical protein